MFDFAICSYVLCTHLREQLGVGGTARGNGDLSRYGLGHHWGDCMRLFNFSNGYLSGYKLVLPNMNKICCRDWSICWPGEIATFGSICIVEKALKTSE